MSYPIYHGIKLAASSEIHNVNIETMLEATLTAVTGGYMVELFSIQTIKHTSIGKTMVLGTLF